MFYISCGFKTIIFIVQNVCIIFLKQNLDKADWKLSHLKCIDIFLRQNRSQELVNHSSVGS